jgi:PLD-like domain
VSHTNTRIIHWLAVVLLMVTRTILVQAYSGTSTPIATARLDAHTRGVQVQVIRDQSQCTEQDSSADFLASHGVPTLSDADHARAHSKGVVSDGATVITGRGNCRQGAQETHAEHVRRISGGEARHRGAEMAEGAWTHPTHPRR